MFLRTLMVVAVASLGLDTPTGCQLDRLARDGRSWCMAALEQVDAWWTRGPVRWWADGPAVAVTTPAPSGTPATMPNGPTAFADVPVMPNGLAAFADGLAMPNALTAFADGPAMPDGLTAFADKASPPAQADASFLAMVDRMAEEFDTQAPAEDVVADPEVAPPSRTEQLSVAFRLTGQAIHAWLSLAQDSPTWD